MWNFSCLAFPISILPQPALHPESLGCIPGFLPHRLLVSSWACPWGAVAADVGRQRARLGIYFPTPFSQVKVLVAQSCPTLCNPMDCSPSGSSVHGTLQARILQWVAMPFSRRSSRPRDQTWVSCIAHPSPKSSSSHMALSAPSFCFINFKGDKTIHL